MEWDQRICLIQDTMNQAAVDFRYPRKGCPSFDYCEDRCAPSWSTDIVRPGCYRSLHSLRNQVKISEDNKPISAGIEPVNDCLAMLILVTCHGSARNTLVSFVLVCIRAWRTTFDCWPFALILSRVRRNISRKTCIHCGQRVSLC